MKLKKVAIAGLMSLPVFSFAAKMPSAEEMWAIIQKQQKQIDALTNQLQSVDNKVDIAGEQISRVSTSSSYSPSSSGGWWEKTQVGGYGEMHYNMGQDDQIDFHRWVLLFGHDFSDNIRMFSEVELEHSLAGEGKDGEIELEQAYVEMDLNESLKAKAGVFLLPVGILNETHEPDTFFGVERNPVEKNIIPTTWWEGGVALNGNSSTGLGWDVALHSGLNVDTEDFKIRGGRQKLAKAEATDGAVTGRLKYTGVPGLELAIAGQYQQDVAQGTLSETADATLFTTHAIYQNGGFGLRALYGRWDINSTTAEGLGRDEQYGFYIEPSYTFETAAGDLGFFARYNQYDTAAGGGGNSEEEQYDFGVNYWPHDNVVLKADLQINEAADSSEDEEILNFGVGYSF